MDMPKHPKRSRDPVQTDLVYNSLNETARRLTVLRVRGITVPDAVRERILAEKEPERLERWLEKAAVAASVAAVIDEPN
jgi:hypothetical protein